MIASAIRCFERLALIALAVSMFAGLASCSGAVGGTAQANDPSRITILPGTGTTLYSGLPTSFVLSGGTGSYIVSSNNQAIIPVAGSVSGNTLTVIPNPVAADTDVTLTVRDTGSTPVASAVVTVKPGTINNDISITPSASQPASCPAGTLCSGGDALVSVALSQGGIPLVGRTVRFDAVSGDFRFITSTTGTSPEVLATSAFAVTDESGHATARIRATAEAPNQSALIQVTDVSSGASRRVSFIIAQSTGTSPGFIATPSIYTFQGPRADQCANIANGTVSATFYIFGGTPPYTITSPTSGLAVSRESVSSSGGSFDVVPTGQCLNNVPITIRDASGHTTTVTVSNIRGTDPVPPLVVGPDSVTLSSCSSIAAVTAAGGTGNYVASSGSGAIWVGRQSNSTFQIQRNPNSGASATPLNVGITDGVSRVNVTVNLTGPGAGACSQGAFMATPNTPVTLASCTGTAQVTLSGGTGNYGATSNNSAVSVTLNGNVLLIGRNKGPQAAGTVTVTATDGAATPISISVTDSAGTCS